jgi:hypothetical protein
VHKLFVKNLFFYFFNIESTYIKVKIDINVTKINLPF